MLSTILSNIYKIIQALISLDEKEENDRNHFLLKLIYLFFKKNYLF